MRVGVHALHGDAHPLQQVGHLFLQFAKALDAPVLQRYRNDLPHCLARIQRGIGVLKDDLGHLVKAQAVQQWVLGDLLAVVKEYGLLRSILGVDGSTLKEYPASRRLVKAGQHPAQRSLATARFTHQPQRLAGIDLEIHPIHRLHPLILPPGQELDQQAEPDREVHFDPLRFDQRLSGHPAPPCRPQ